MNPSQSDESGCRYSKIQREAETLIRQQGFQWSLMAYPRGALFLLAIACVVCAFAQVGGLFQVWFWLAGLLFVGFLVIAAYHTNLELAMDSARRRLRYAKRSIARKERDWQNLPKSNVEPFDGFENVAKDLDLFGQESLFQLTGTVYTQFGIERFRSWISEGASTAEVKQRQEAVAEMMDHDEWRDRFSLDCEYLGASSTGPAAFSEWSESEPWLAKRGWLLWMARILGAAVLLSLFATIFGLLPKEIGLPALFGFIIVNFFISVFFAGRIHEVFNSIASKKKEIDVYQKLFGDIKAMQVNSTMLTQLKEQMTSSQSGAIHRLNSLGGLVWMANLRRNGILFLAYLFLQFFFNWDVHVLDLLERWQKRNGRYVRDWFVALGAWECINSLAKLASDQPDWQFPEVVDFEPDEIQIEGEEIGHPLLPDGIRVCNNVSVGPPGSVLLVTGSNMSGKSTLLRSLGVNLVLAQMGSVVCAKRLKCTPMRIETSMRIHDDLASGVSFFMAELKRLKMVVDIANSRERNKPLLFLLDEILQGTNSGERHIAVTQVVQSLIRSGAIGAISTHDLELANDGSLGELCETVHFREHFFEKDGKEVMEFDYVMRQGVSPTTNALKLLKLVGLNVDENA